MDERFTDEEINDLQAKAENIFSPGFAQPVGLKEETWQKTARDHEVVIQKAHNIICFLRSELNDADARIQLLEKEMDRLHVRADLAEKTAKARATALEDQDTRHKEHIRAMSINISNAQNQMEQYRQFQNGVLAATKIVECCSRNCSDY